MEDLLRDLQNHVQYVLLKLKRSKKGQIFDRSDHFYLYLAGRYTRGIPISIMEASKLQAIQLEDKSQEELKPLLMALVLVQNSK